MYLHSESKVIRVSARFFLQTAKIQVKVKYGWIRNLMSFLGLVISFHGSGSVPLTLYLN